MELLIAISLLGFQWLGWDPDLPPMRPLEKPKKRFAVPD